MRYDERITTKSVSSLIPRKPSFTTNSRGKPLSLNLCFLVVTGDEESDQQAVFCSLGLSYQSIKNAQIRNHFKMSSEMTGILINKINLWSGAYGILKKNDIILAIDGVPIANDATGHYIKFLFFFVYIV